MELLVIKMIFAAAAASDMPNDVTVHHTGHVTLPDAQSISIFYHVALMDN